MHPTPYGVGWIHPTRHDFWCLHLQFSGELQVQTSGIMPGPAGPHYNTQSSLKAYPLHSVLYACKALQTTIATDSKSRQTCEPFGKLFWQSFSSMTIQQHQSAVSAWQTLQTLLCRQSYALQIALKRRRAWCCMRTLRILRAKLCDIAELGLAATLPEALQTQSWALTHCTAFPSPGL